MSECWVKSKLFQFSQLPRNLNNEVDFWSLHRIMDIYCSSNPLGWFIAFHISCGVFVAFSISLSPSTTPLHSSPPLLLGWHKLHPVSPRQSAPCSINAVQRENNDLKPIFFVIDPIYPTPPLGQDMTQGQFFKRRLRDLNSEFSFS